MDVVLKQDSWSDSIWVIFYMGLCIVVQQPNSESEDENLACLYTSTKTNVLRHYTKLQHHASICNLDQFWNDGLIYNDTR